MATVLAHSLCSYDGVKIYKGSSQSQNLLTTLCGNTVPGTFSTFGPMLINFYSDFIVNDNGFLAEYMAIRECYILQCCQSYSMFQCYLFSACTNSKTMAVNNHILLSNAYHCSIIYSNISFGRICVQGYRALVNFGTGTPVALAVTLVVGWGCLPMAGMSQSSTEYKNVA